MTVTSDGTTCPVGEGAVNIQFIVQMEHTLTCTRICHPVSNVFVTDKFIAAMPRSAATNVSKVRAYTSEFSKEFISTPKNELFCEICAVTVNHERRSTVTKHRETAKHQAGLQKTKVAATQSFISTTVSDQTGFSDKIVTAFLSADIPLYKVHNPELKSLFQFMGRVLPSESNLRSRVDVLAEKEALRIKETVAGKKIFLVTDESEIKGKKYFNTLLGTIENPEKTFLVDCRVCEVSVDSQYVVHLVDDFLKNLEINRHDFVLLLSDAARYMTAAGNILKVLYPQLFHVTCVSHLLHNCAEKVRAHYGNVDNLIARIKAVTVKNKQRKEAFKQIGQPPEPVLTRWTTWLRAAMYYADNLPTVKTIVNSFSGGGVLVRRAKEALSDSTLAASLLAIKSDYEFLIPLVEKSESQKYCIAAAYEDLRSIDCGQDVCQLKEYIKKRIEKNGDLTAIATLSRNDTAPSDYLLLQRCQATSVSVERSFSMLNKLLAKDRQFKDNNVVKYMMLLYNKRVQD